MWWCQWWRWRSCGGGSNSAGSPTVMTTVHVRGVNDRRYRATRQAGIHVASDVNQYRV